jgi:signal transduction histidine kinase
MGFAVKIYYNHYERTMYRLESEAAKIEHTFTDTFDLTSELMKMIADQIVHNHEDKEYIKNILYKYKANPNVLNVLSWTSFFWVDSNNKVAIDGNDGICAKNIDVSNRSYIKQAAIRPNEFIIGDLVEGATSKKTIIPAGVGVVDYNGHYVGAVSIGFDINKLSARLASSTKTIGAEFLLLDENLNLVLSYANSKFNPEAAKNLIKRNKGHLSQLGDFHSKLKDLIQGNNYYVTKIDKYPFILCVYFDKNIVIQYLWEDITSRLIEISVVVMVSFLLVIFIYRREVFLRREAEYSREIAIMASKSKSDFLAYTAHELRTPLGFIVTGSEVVKNQLFGKLPEKYSDYVNNIHQSAIELLELLDDLLDEMRVERGKFKIYNNLVDVNDIFNKVVKKNLIKLDKAKIKINVDVQNDLPSLISDSKRLMQIFNNLISNSIKYSPPKINLQLIAKISEGNLLLSVIDQGFGISKKDIEVALSKYGTIKNKNSQKVESIGLGLPLVKMLTKELGADFVIKSEKEVGTNITIIFPESQLKYK